MPIEALDGFSQTHDELWAALDASGVVGTWDWDCVRRQARYDRGAAELLAGDPDLAGRILDAEMAMARIHPEDADWLRDEMMQAIVAGGLILSEYRVVTPNRGMRWLLSRGRVYQDPHGRPVRCKGILIDITETRDEGSGYLARTAPRPEDPIDRATACCLEARRAIDEASPIAARSGLRLTLDLALFELGRLVAARGRG